MRQWARGVHSFYDVQSDARAPLHALVMRVVYHSRAVALTRPPSPHIFSPHFSCRCVDSECAGEALRGAIPQRFSPSTYNAVRQRGRARHWQAFEQLFAASAARIC